MAEVGVPGYKVHFTGCKGLCSSYGPNLWAEMGEFSSDAHK